LHMVGYYTIVLSLVAILVNILIWIWVLSDVVTNFGDSFGDWWIGGGGEIFEFNPEAMLVAEMSILASTILCPIGIFLLFCSNSFHAEAPKLS